MPDLTERWKALQEHRPALDLVEKQRREMAEAYAGAIHAMNLVHNEARSQHERLKALEAHSEASVKAVEALSATVGEMQMEILRLTERMEKMSQWALKQGKGK